LSLAIIILLLAPACIWNYCISIRRSS